MALIHHLNNGCCEKCTQIFDRYPNFHPGLRAWFVQLQKMHPEAHISWAGRGKEDQERFCDLGKSNAHYGQSAHNFNAALDLFKLTQLGADFDRYWFRDIVGVAVINYNADPGKELTLEWYGMPHAKYFELPHIEDHDWKALQRAGKLKLVE